VESHRARLMSKLEVESLADLVRLEWVAIHDRAA
jgi:FixJ family two-component response regulator